MDGYWFTSTKFEIEPGEDEEINPGIYGRQLARWFTLLEKKRPECAAQLRPIFFRLSSRISWCLI